MRRARRLIASIALLSLAFGALAVAEEAKVDERKLLVTPIVDKVYVYSGPGTGYPYLGYLKQGYSLELCGEIAYWYQVCIGDGRVGYVFAATAKKVVARAKSGEAKTPPPVAPPPVAPSATIPPPPKPEPVAPIPVAPPPVTPKPVAPEPVTPRPVTPEPVAPTPVAPEPPPLPPASVEVEPSLGEADYVIEAETITVVSLRPRTPPPAPAAPKADAKGARHGVVLFAGAGPGPIDLTTDPAALRSGTVWAAQVGIGYDFAPVFSGKTPLVFGLEGVGLYGAAQEADDVVKLARRAERYGDVVADLAGATLALRFAPLATKFADLRLRVGPTYLRLTYYQDFDRAVVVREKPYAKGRDEFLVLDGLGYQAGASLSVYPFATLGDSAARVGVRLDVSFTHILTALNERSDTPILEGRVRPRLMFPSLGIGYVF
jgi:uncharacterized protein YraI